MGLSVSAATVIIFSAVIVLAADFVMIYDEVLKETREAIDERDDRASEMASTSISIRELNGSGSVLFVNITNDGATVIDVGGCDILLDGVLSTDSIAWNLSGVLGYPGSDLWGPGEAVTFAFEGLSADRVKIVCQNGMSDVMVVG